MAMTDSDSLKSPISARHTLAADLVRHMGREGAVNACRANGWAGVLEIVLRDFLGRDSPRPGRGISPTETPDTLGGRHRIPRPDHPHQQAERDQHEQRQTQLHREVAQGERLPGHRRAGECQAEE